jgi:signal transduction histidine kinase
MSDRRRWPQHAHGPGTGHGFRPPWWPENEPFPPMGPVSWRGMRRRFLRRVLIAMAVFFGLMFAANAIAVALFPHAFGARGHWRAGGVVWFLGVWALVAFVAIRSVRRVAASVGDVMEAADRVAGGDYEARVSERGPRDMRRLARSFNEMAQRLQANEQQRRSLLADIAHELRTPLSVIQGNIEGMLDGLYQADPAHLEAVLEETRVMSRLLEDLQTLSTAEAGALRLYRESVAPADLVANAVTASRARADAEGVRVEQRVSPGLPEIEVDPMRVGEVFANLLHNAVRHTPSGGSVLVSAERAGTPDGPCVAFAVADTGPGIAPDVLPHVFDRFVKASDSGGAGLGLAIARSLVEAHGGTITAESPGRSGEGEGKGKGTTMRFVLPVNGRPAP